MLLSKLIYAGGHGYTTVVTCNTAESFVSNSQVNRLQSGPEKREHMIRATRGRAVLTLIDNGVATFNFTVDAADEKPRIPKRLSPVLSYFDDLVEKQYPYRHSLRQPPARDAPVPAWQDSGMELLRRLQFVDLPHRRRACVSYVSRDLQSAMLEIHKFDRKQLAPMKQKCQLHCLSTLNHIVAFCYNDAHVVRSDVQQSLHRFQGTTNFD